MKSFLSELRCSLVLMLEETGCQGPVPIRRAASDEYLLSLPLVMRESRETCVRFQKMAETNGWYTTEWNGWILLAKEFQPPMEREIHPEGECAAVCSILLRHPSTERSAVYTNRILKAADENLQALESTCGKMHSEFSAMLREGKALPDLYGFLNDAIWRYEVC